MRTFQKILFVMLLLPMMVKAQDRVMLVADPHVFSQSLLEQGAAFDAMMKGQRKMLDLSEVAFKALVDTALHYKPELVLIPGDLTKDGEIESHALVVKELKRLRDAGIEVLVIPGNHDLDGKAYAYRGEEKLAVESLKDADWKKTYAWVYDGAVAKDASSHSYVAEPLRGVTVLGIDASHGAGEGSLSDETMSWVLKQADAAAAKGNMIVAMCHWQLLEHVDGDGMMLESGRLLNAEAVRDSLMAHGVRLVLTGHMHINSISTYRDTLRMSGDSIVEVSTGSPITYPCPYRWLTIAKDRSSVEVSTEMLTALPAYADLESYSRAWMSEHAKTLLPGISDKIIGQLLMVMEAYMRELIQDESVEMMIELLRASMPQSREEKTAMVEKHIGNTMVEMYLLHSDGNEPENAQADSLVQVLYSGVGSLIQELMAFAFLYYPEMQQPLIDAVVATMQAPVQSLVEDRTQWVSADYSDVTDDLYVELVINKVQHTAVENVGVENTEEQMYDLLGRRVNKPGRGLYIQKGKKVLIWN